MARGRSGSIWKNRGNLYARITYVDEFGKRKDVRRKARSRTHARQIIKEMLREIEERGEGSLDTSRLTFAQLAKHYKDRYATPARYIESRKIAGLRSHAEVKRIVEVLVSHFGSKRLRSITHGDILRFKSQRLDTIVRFKKAPPPAKIHCHGQQGIDGTQKECSRLPSVKDGYSSIRSPVAT